METIEVFLQWRDEDHQIIRVNEEKLLVVGADMQCSDELN
jgi:hypothetical protein